MWERINKSPSILELKPSREIEGISPDNLIFLELTGSGVGDQYLFQGRFILTEGHVDLYNLGIYTLGPRWTVRSLTKGRYTTILSRSERETGRDLARKLVTTLPEIATIGSRHTTKWLKAVWESDTTKSHDVDLAQLLAEEARHNVNTCSSHLSK